MLKRVCKGLLSIKFVPILLTLSIYIPGSVNVMAEGLKLSRTKLPVTLTREANAAAFHLYFAASKKYIDTELSVWGQSGVDKVDRQADRYLAAASIFNVFGRAIPVISDINKSLVKNGSYTFSAADFTEKFVDLQQHNLLKIKIITLPSSGILKLNGTDVTIDKEILVDSLSQLTFTPSYNFIGLVSFSYNSACVEGYATTNKNVNLTVVDPGVPPIAVPDNYLLTTGNTLMVASPGVLANDTDEKNYPLTAVKVSNPANGSLTLNANGSFIYVNNGGVNTSDSFTYVANNGYLNSNIIKVNILINASPKISDMLVLGNSSVGVILRRADFEAKFADTDTLKKIRIVTLPTIGVLKVNGTPISAGQEFDPFPNLITWEPPRSWSGTTSFQWNASDGVSYADNSAQVIITIDPPSDPGAKIGLAKQLASVKPNLNGTYDLKFLFTVVNFGTNDLDKVSVKDNLALAFNGAEFKVKSLSAGGNLRVNTGFTGIGDSELLLNTSKLVGGEEARIELDINVKLLLTGGTFFNSAIAEGISHITGLKVTDISTNGLKPDPLNSGDVSPLENTEIKLELLPTYVPQGFSPNGDGINDKFVIHNTGGRRLSLEIYNRWGNRVYKSDDYKNDWGGEAVEGISTASGVPDGTYYYVIIIDKKDKHSGFITVNR